MKRTFENKQIKHALAPSNDWEKIKRKKIYLKIAKSNPHQSHSLGLTDNRNFDCGEMPGL